MNLKYILATEGDRAFFIHVHHTAYRDTIEEMFGWDEKRQDELANRPFDEGGIHIIWNDDNRIGVVGWEERYDHLWLKELFLLPEYQGQGIGSQIIKDTITKARSVAKDIRLRTLKANMRAKELYERYGFELTEETDIHWNMILKAKQPVGQKWPDCDPKITEFVNSAMQVFKDSIHEKLDAVFLHGSLAMGSFYPPKSDIDLLIVANRSLNLNEQKLIHNRLIDLTDNRPITGFLELSIVLSDHAQQPKHPIPYELHFGEEFPKKIISGEFDYDKAKGNDPDLAAHFTVTKNRGISLFGPTPKQVLGDIPWQDYLDSVLDDLDWILDEKNILTSPFYGVLNCCRVLEMLEKGEGTVSSKEEGALWALDTLTTEHHDIIRFALECYKSDKSISSKQRQKAGLDWPEDKLLKFRDYVRVIKNEGFQ